MRPPASPPPRLARARRCLGLSVLSLALACASYDTDHPRSESTAFRDYASTHLGRVFEPPPRAEAGESGVDLIRRGRVALEARLALADLAEHSLDLQYYIWDADVSGRLLGEALYRAAERGVRVRVLVDDIAIVDRDAQLARFSGHPRIEVRAFNPFRQRRGRLVGFLTDPSRVNRRAHNKVMIADNAAAIIGGRNIADHYFGVHGESNYRDLDTFAVGPVVREASRVFDDFWNSPWAVPYAAFVDEEPTQKDAEEQVAAMRAQMAADPLPYPLAEDVAQLRESLQEIREGLVWAPVRVLYDDPSKAEDPDVRGIAGEMVALGEGAREEILIENAYFVPRERMVEIMADAVRRGVHVRVLTNSLASNDVVAVHAGYKKYRDDLLESGVEIHELRPDSAMKEEWSILSTQSRAGLHAKTLLVDGRRAVIGSYNLDPRSADINTELVILVESPVFGERLRGFLEDGVAPENAYRVRLEDGDLVWTTHVDGEPVVHTAEPETSLWQRFVVGLIGILPVQSQL